MRKALFVLLFALFVIGVPPRRAPSHSTVTGHAVPRSGPVYRPNYRPYAYVRPYYVWRPRVYFGYGLWVGYPYDYPREYPYYGAYPSGVSVSVTPANAAVFVDGFLVGNGNNGLIALAPGPHHIDIQAPGYQPITFDVNVQVDQVIPYQGSMQPLR